MLTYDVHINQHPLDTLQKLVLASLGSSFLFLLARVFLRFHCSIEQWPKINPSFLFIS